MWYVIWKRVSREIVLRAAFAMPPERRKALERRMRGKEEFRKLRLADCVIVSFGKSGRTWLRVLVSRFYQLRYGLRPSLMIGFDNFHRRNPAIPRIFFTHDNYLRDYTGHREDKRDFYDRRVVLLVRDPRDVAVSQYFQWKFRMRPAKKTLNDYPTEDVDIFTFVMSPAGLPKVVDFLNGWGREIPRIPRFLLLRYEDLKADTAGELARLLAFMGERPTAEELADCVSFASVENMRKLEEKRVFWLAGSRLRPKDRSNPNSYKVRRAKVGGWRDYFDDAQVAAIDAYVAEHLDPQFGYRVTERPVAADAAPAS